MFGTKTAFIGGRNRTLKFNLNANYEFCKLHSLTPDEVFGFFTDSKNVTGIRDMILCALKSADLEAGNTIDYNQYSVGTWIEEMDQEKFNDLVLGSSDANAKSKGGKKKEAKE